MFTANANRQTVNFSRLSSVDIYIVYDSEICSLFACWIDLRAIIKYEIKIKVNFLPFAVYTESQS